MQREVVAHWLDGFQRRMDDVVDVATREIRSVSGNEDSLVFLLGVLNLGTLLCYAVHSQLTHSRSDSGSDATDSGRGDQFLYQKIQSVLDDLVLHVHTRTYYRNILRQDQERGFQSGRSAKMSESGSRMGDGMTPTAIRHRNDYERFIKQRVVKMMQEWISVLQPEAGIRRNSGGRGFHGRRKRETRRRLRNNAGRRVQHHPARTNNTFIRRRHPVSGIAETGAVQPPMAESAETVMLPIGGGRGGTHWRLGSVQRRPNRPTQASVAEVTVPSSSPQPPEAEKRSITWNPSGSPKRVNAVQPVMERNSHPLGRNPIPKPELGGSGMLTPLLPSGIPTPTPNDTLTMLMALVSEASSLTLDVLNVFKSRATTSGDIYSAPSDTKCLERLLCQLNQDWRGKGVATAAFAPFLSISMGWMLDGSENAEFPHVLMAVRAGWMGKRCTTLYPRCKRPDRIFWNPHPQFHPTPLPSPTAAPTTTAAPPPPPTTTTAATKKPILYARPLKVDSIRKKTDVVDFSQENYDSAELASAGGLDPGTWGKPSRLSLADEVELGDISRGVYGHQLNHTSYAGPDAHEEDEDDEDEDEDDEEYDDDDDDDDDDEEENEEDEEDLEEEESNEEAAQPEEEQVAATAAEPEGNAYNYQQIPTENAVKTERLMLMPHGENYSWSASPTSPASFSEEENQLKADGLRRRDRTPFTHADAVKDDRFNEMIMLYLRDRSAK